ncbi:MAG: DUF3301 domain-containing protein, partial [Pseudomonadota bacterium]
QTVQVRQMKLKRDDAGSMRIARMYSFEFSTSGHERDMGYAVTLGDRLVQVHLDLDVDQARTIH